MPRAIARQRCSSAVFTLLAEVTASRPLQRSVLISPVAAVLRNRALKIHRCPRRLSATMLGSSRHLQKERGSSRASRRDIRPISFPPVVSSATDAVLAKSLSVHRSRAHPTPSVLQVPAAVKTRSAIWHRYVKPMQIVALERLASAPVWSPERLPSGTINALQRNADRTLTVADIPALSAT